MTKTGDYLTMKKETVKRLKAGMRALPPRSVLLMLLAEAGEILSGIGCGELKLDDIKTRIKTLKFCTMLQGILDDVAECEESKKLIADEDREIMDRMIRNTSSEDLTEAMSSYSEHRINEDPSEEAIDSLGEFIGHVKSTKDKIGGA